MEKEYRLMELTPKNMQCMIGGCPAIFELTKKNAKCVGGGCPSVYEEQCIGGACPSIYEECVGGGCPAIEEHEGKYLIVGDERPSEGNYDVVRIPTGILANADKKRLRILKEGNRQTDVAGKKIEAGTLPKEISFLEKKVGAGEILINAE